MDTRMKTTATPTPKATQAKTISPIGPSAAEETRAAAKSDPALRAELDRIAPFEEIAEKVIIGRTMKGYTQLELAEIIGTSYSQISRIESGRHLPDLITLDSLGRALDVTFDVPLKEVDLTVVRPRRKTQAPYRGTSTPAPMWAAGLSAPEKHKS